MEYVGEVLDHKQFRSVLEPNLSLPCETKAPTSVAGYDILVWNRILLFSSLTFKMPTKNEFLKKFLLLITF